jgi:hypothetical protein
MDQVQTIGWILITEGKQGCDISDPTNSPRSLLDCSTQLDLATLAHLDRNSRETSHAV